MNPEQERRLVKAVEEPGDGSLVFFGLIVHACAVYKGLELIASALR